jgi:hypothetical protein
VGALDRLYQRYRDRVEFLLIYIREAHPADGWSVQLNPRLRYVKQPATSLQRFQVANSCVADLQISIPCLIDSMDNAAMEAYNALPDRLYLVGRNGRIAFKGRHGPFGFKPSELEAAIETELASLGSER